MTLINHPSLAESRFDALEETDFICRDLDAIRCALLSALIRLDDGPFHSSDLIAEIERDGGENPMPALTATPQAREARFASAHAPVAEAEMGFEEIFARHQALIAHAKEVAEAEQDIVAAPGEDLDRRLSASAERRQRDGTPQMPDVQDEDESRMSDHLADVLNSLSSIKKGRRS